MSSSSSSHFIKSRTPPAYSAYAKYGTSSTATTTSSSTSSTYSPTVYTTVNKQSSITTTTSSSSAYTITLTSTKSINPMSSNITSSGSNHQSLLGIKDSKDPSKPSSSPYSYKSSNYNPSSKPSYATTNNRPFTSTLSSSATSPIRSTGSTYSSSTINPSYATPNTTQAKKESFLNSNTTNPSYSTILINRGLNSPSSNAPKAAPIPLSRTYSPSTTRPTSAYSPPSATINKSYSSSPPDRPYSPSSLKANNQANQNQTYSTTINRSYSPSNRSSSPTINPAFAAALQPPPGTKPYQYKAPTNPYLPKKSVTSVKTSVRDVPSPSPVPQERTIDISYSRESRDVPDNIQSMRHPRSNGYSKTSPGKDRSSPLTLNVNALKSPSYSSTNYSPKGKLPTIVTPPVLPTRRVTANSPTGKTSQRDSAYNSSYNRSQTPSPLPQKGDNHNHHLNDSTLVRSYATTPANLTHSPTLSNKPFNEAIPYRASPSLRKKYPSSRHSQRSSNNPTANPSLTLLKVVKYLFICTLLVLIIGAIVICGVAVDEIINQSNQIATIQQYGITELAANHSEIFDQKRTTSILTFVIHVAIIIFCCLGLFAGIREHFLMLVTFASVNALILLISLWAVNVRASIVLLQVAVTFLALILVLEIHRQIKQEIKRRRSEKKKEAKKILMMTNGVHQNPSNGKVGSSPHQEKSSIGNGVSVQMEDIDMDEVDLGVMDEHDQHHGKNGYSNQQHQHEIESSSPFDPKGNERISWKRI